MEHINITGKSLPRIKITGKTICRIEPEEFAKLLGTEPYGPPHGNLDLISLGHLGSKLVKKLNKEN